MTWQARLPAKITKFGNLMITAGPCLPPTAAIPACRPNRARSGHHQPTTQRPWLLACSWPGYRVVLEQASPSLVVVGMAAVAEEQDPELEPGRQPPCGQGPEELVDDRDV